MSNIHQINQKTNQQQSDDQIEETRLNDASDWIAKLDRDLTNQKKNNSLNGCLPMH